MKKRAVSVILIMFLIFSVSFAVAQSNETDDKAYDCLEEKVQGECSSLSAEAKIFSLLAIGECKDEVLADSSYESDVTLTAQAILALNEVNVNTDGAEEWLLTKTISPPGIDWLLQIETDEATTCSIIYEGGTVNININEDKTISGASGCLTSYFGGYWLKVSDTCYNKEFSISCSSGFLTTLLYKKTDSLTFYVSEKTSSASSGGTTTEKVDSFCFGDTSCDYEASLWAAVVLNFLSHETSSYIPYLISMMNDIDNQKYIPEAFLYLLTNEFRNELLSEQLSDGYWQKSDDKFYDTALALYPFQYEEFQEKTDAINWLEDVQGKDGCWNSGNIRDTAFLLYSIWPKTFYVGDGDVGVNCEDAGGYCMSSMSCQEAGGSVLDYYCSALFKCCDTEIFLDTCDDQAGEICTSDEICAGGTSADASDISYGEICCVNGECRTPSQESECESYDGICRDSCYSDEEESYYSCDSGELCCVEKTISEKKSYWWVWWLLILIFLAVMGIVFKDRLRPIWFKIKSKFGKSKPGPKPRGPRPGFPPSRMPQRRVISRRALPPARRIPLRKPGTKPRPEMDDVLKKLKEMGK